MESVKRQQLIFSANQAVTDGQQLLAVGKYDDAAGRFQYALDSLTAGGVSASLYNRACAGLAAAKAGQARQAAKDTKFAEAATLLQQAISLQPDDPAYPKAIEELKQEQVAYEQQVHDPEGTTNNPAVTDEFKDKVAAVQKLALQGDAYFRTGQYERAEDTYSKILILDPYNKMARDKMDRMDKYRTRAAGFRHEEHEEEALLHVNQGWEESISPDIVVAPVAVNTDTNGGTNRASITRKLQSIVIDKVNFDKLDISTVIQFLQEKSKELDPDHQGINFVLRLAPNSSTAAPADATGAAPAAGAVPAQQAIHRDVSITLDKIPLVQLLQYITQQTNLQFSVEDYAVYLRPSIDEGETLTVRTFLVPPNFFTQSTLRVSVAPTTDFASTTIASISVPVKDDLISKGIRFPDGATATFLPGSSKLVVRNTPEQLDLIANLIESMGKETPQINIEVKIAEFNQDLLKSLSFNYQVGLYAITGGLTDPIAPFESFAAQTALRTADYNGTGNGALTPDSIDTLIAQNPSSTSTAFANQFPLTGNEIQPNSPNELVVGAVLDQTGMAAMIDAINNTAGVSLVSAPSVTTQNQLKANIDIVQEFPYPTSFDKPKLGNNNGYAYSSGSFGPTVTQIGDVIVLTEGQPLQLAIPPTPREFVTQDVGVSLEVKPTIYPDKRIDLDITKAQVVDFDGFIDYGVPIRARLSNDSPPANQEGTILTQGTINQPVFNLRSIVTNLQILDGQTAVLGGLVREDTQEINDKVPVLGDLPLVGRLFQSKVSERTKKNLIFFVTGRLIKSNGKPQYVKTLNAEPEEEALPEPEQIGPGVILPPLPEGTPNS